MKEIQLTQGKVTLVDNEDFEKLNWYKWHARFNRIWYARRRDINGKTIHMHREILNATKGIQVDHRNSDGLDNRRENLRLCTSQENAFNRKNCNKNNKVGTKGVHWHKASKKFVAEIQFNGKRIHLGCFNILGDADSAYRVAEEKYFGQFARKG